VLYYTVLPSVLWCCWLGGKKGIRPVKNRVVGCWHGYLSGARCRLACSSWCHCHSLTLASVKFRLVLPFWYWLTLVVPEKGPLNGCVCCVVLHFFDWWMQAFVVLGLDFFIPSQEIGLRKRLWNDLFCVQWDMKPQLNQSAAEISLSHCCFSWHRASCGKNVW